MKRKRYIQPRINIERMNLQESFLQSSVGPGNQVEHGSGAAKMDSFYMDEEYDE